MVENGLKAAERVREQRYDVVFMDCHMPLLDGLEATRRIREAEPDGVHTPIVAMTASAMPDDREACFAAGMDDFISKPIRRRDLVGILERFCETLEQHTTPPALPRQTPPSPTSDGQDDLVLDPALILDTIGHDAGMIREFVRVFLADLPVQIRKLEDTARTGDLVQLQRHAHTIRGAAADVGGRRLSRLAGEIEYAARKGDPRTSGDAAKIRSEFDLLAQALQSHDWPQ